MATIVYLWQECKHLSLYGSQYGGFLKPKSKSSIPGYLHINLAVMVHDFNPSTQKAETGGSL